MANVMEILSIGLLAMVLEDWESLLNMHYLFVLQRLPCSIPIVFENRVSHNRQRLYMSPRSMFWLDRDAIILVLTMDTRMIISLVVADVVVVAVNSYMKIYQHRCPRLLLLVLPPRHRVRMMQRL